MSIKVTWAPSTEPDISGYLIQSSADAIAWASLATIPHNLTGPNFDDSIGKFFFDHSAGTTSTWYRLIAVDTVANQSAPSSPFRVQADSESAQVQVQVPVSNVATLLAAGFSRIELWVSTDQGATYAEMTAVLPTPAQIASLPALTTFQMAGRLLKFKVNGGLEREVAFDETLENWTPLQVAARIGEVVPSLATVVDGSVVLTSPTTGRGSTIEITFCNATSLGWSSGMKALGKIGRVPLELTKRIYTIGDLGGSVDYRYKWRFSADGASPISEFSPRVLGSQRPANANLLSIGTAVFLGSDGRPRKTSIIIAPAGSPSLIGGFFVGTDLPLVVESDSFGYLQVPMLRGLRVRVAIEGTSFVREFVVPNTDSFDILTAMAAVPDPFTVQVPPPFAIKRSL